jgi:hypothetical protein
MLRALLAPLLLPAGRRAGGPDRRADRHRRDAHRGRDALNGRLDLLTIAVDELVDELYTQLHRAADRAAANQDNLGP